MYDREIDVANDWVIYSAGRGAKVDCTVLRDQGIAFIIQQGADMWCEREPFTGRDTEFDAAIAEELFRQAELAGAEEDRINMEIENTAKRKVYALHFARAIEEKELQAQYEEFLNSPDRTFLEKEEIRLLSEWDRESSLYKALISHLGLSKKAENALFLLARSYTS